MTKAELEAEVKDLRAKVEMLEGRLLIAEQQRTTVVLPGPSYPPHGWYPGGWPQVWCGINTSLGVNGVAINAKSVN